MSESTPGRLLDLLSLLQARREWGGQELADRLGVSPRTVRRDVERLRRLGYPVDSLTGPAGGYRLRAGKAMPPLLLDDEEATAIAVGLRTAAGASVTGIEETALRALVKLEQVLPGHLRRRVSALQGATATLPWPAGASVDPQALAVIAAACRDRERVRFGYTARDGKVSRRDVEPHSLVHAGRRWYLAAFDPARAAWRTFRVDRLARAASTGVRFEPRPLPGGDAARFVEASLSARPRIHDARVLLHAPATRFARRRWLGGTIEPVDDRSCRFATSDDDLDWLALRIAMLGVDFEVEHPPELAERLRALGQRIARAVG